MNRGGGVCPCYGHVYQSACLNSVKTFGREDEGSFGRMVTAQRGVQLLLFLRIAAPGPVTKDYYLGRHFYWVRELTTSSLPKTNVLHLQQVCTHKHVKKGCHFSYTGKQQLSHYWK